MRDNIFSGQGRENVEVNKYFMPRNVLICLGHSGIMNSVRK